MVETPDPPVGLHPQKSPFAALKYASHPISNTAKETPLQSDEFDISSFLTLKTTKEKTCSTIDPVKETPSPLKHHYVNSMTENPDTDDEDDEGSSMKENPDIGTEEEDEETPQPPSQPQRHQASFAPRSGAKLTTEERRLKRQQRQKNAKSNVNMTNDQQAVLSGTEDQGESRFHALMKRNEDELLEFVAKVNSVYQDVLKKDAPFMTFVFCGMQSAGKSTIMERFLNAALNIVQEGTGTRCPLDTTCIHDASIEEPTCQLTGDELSGDKCGQNLSVQAVFERITKHNQELASADRFSIHSLRLIFRSPTVQNMRFVDTPGIISNKSTGKDNRNDIKKDLAE